MDARPTPKPPDHDAQASTIASGILHALVAKLDLTLGDVDVAVLQLGEAFEDMAHSARSLSASSNITGSEGEQQALQALQFHDRLEQRLQHVARALQQIAQLLDAGPRRACDWTTLARELSAACPIESDKKLFDDLLGHASEPAPPWCKQTASFSKDDVEIF